MRIESIHVKTDVGDIRVAGYPDTATALRILEHQFELLERETGGRRHLAPSIKTEKVRR
jgi:hypothetical protein